MRGNIDRRTKLTAAAASVAVVILAPATAQAPRLLAPPIAAEGQLSFADLVERVSPSVVSIMTEREVERPSVPEAFAPFFRFGLPRGDGDEGEGRGDGFGGGVERLEAQGSGFFIDGQGHVVTNNHVIEGADTIRIRLNNGTEIPAKLVGADPETDLAVLKVEAPKGQSFVQFADDVTLRVGDWVLAVGNPFGLSGTVTSGIVSAIGGENREGTFNDFIQIDAPINRGNSGGPTFDLKGRVVGVNTAIYSPTGGNVGIGFAIPSRVAKDTVAQLIRTGSVTRGWLGVSIQPMTNEIAAALGRKDTKGALVAEVLPGTPAANAGFESGDLVTKLEGRAIADPRDLTRSISALAPGSKAKVTVLRSGAEKTLTVTLGTRDDNAQPADDRGQPSPGVGVSVDVGVRVAELSDLLRQQYRIPAGVAGLVVTGVKSGSAAEEAGLRPGVVILQVDGQATTTGAAFKQKIDGAAKAGRDAVLLRLQVGSAKQFAALALAKK